MSRSSVVQIRVTVEEKEGMDAAADIAGISLSGWVRERLRMAASQELARVGRKAPFLKPVTLQNDEQ
jgi:uncharacterized protein (DUF1778 family)